MNTMAKMRFGACAVIVLICVQVSNLQALEGDGTSRTEPSSGPSADHSATEALRVVFFHSPSCEECHEVRNALPRITARWGGRILLELKSIEDVEGFTELLCYQEHYHQDINAPPVMFIGSQCLKGARSIIERMDRTIAEELDKGSSTFLPPAPNRAESSDPVPIGVWKHFESFSVLAVAISGLVDGINPCAFTTIVFFLSMLAYLRKAAGQILGAGIGFTAGVFVAYYLIGLGLLGAVKSLSVSHGLSSALAYGVGILALILAAWSFVDALRYMRTGSAKAVTLGLPSAVKNRIHAVIRGGLTTRNLVAGSVGVGFLVSILESLCTGQAYLPTIIFINKSQGLRSHAVGWLLLYNVMFIIPLVAILILAYLGVKSDVLGNYLRRHMTAFKLAMAALFAGLGVLVLATN